MSTTDQSQIASAVKQAREIVAKAKADAPVDILLKKVPRDTVNRLEAERAKRGLRSRDATIRAILGEALSGNDG